MCEAGFFCAGCWVKRQFTQATKTDCLSFPIKSVVLQQYITRKVQYSQLMCHKGTFMLEAPPATAQQEMDIAYCTSGYYASAPLEHKNIAGIDDKRCTWWDAAA